MADAIRFSPGPCGCCDNCLKACYLIADQWGASAIPVFDPIQEVTFIAQVGLAISFAPQAQIIRLIAPNGSRFLMTRGRGEEPDANDLTFVRRRQGDGADATLKWKEFPDKEPGVAMGPLLRFPLLKNWCLVGGPPTGRIGCFDQLPPTYIGHPYSFYGYVEELEFKYPNGGGAKWINGFLDPPSNWTAPQNFIAGQLPAGSMLLLTFGGISTTGIGFGWAIPDVRGDKCLDLIIYLRNTLPGPGQLKYRIYHLPQAEGSTGPIGSYESSCGSFPPYQKYPFLECPCVPPGVPLGCGYGCLPGNNNRVRIQEPPFGLCQDTAIWVEHHHRVYESAAEALAAKWTITRKDGGFGGYFDGGRTMIANNLTETFDGYVIRQGFSYREAPPDPGEDGEVPPPPVGPFADLWHAPQGMKLRHGLSDFQSNLRPFCTPLVEWDAFTLFDGPAYEDAGIKIQEGDPNE